MVAAQEITVPTGPVHRRVARLRSDHGRAREADGRREAGQRNRQRDVLDRTLDLRGVRCASTSTSRCIRVRASDCEQHRGRIMSAREAGFPTSPLPEQQADETPLTPRGSRTARDAAERSNRIVTITTIVRDEDPSSYWVRRLSPSGIPEPRRPRRSVPDGSRGCARSVHRKRSAIPTRADVDRQDATIVRHDTPTRSDPRNTPRDLARAAASGSTSDPAQARAGSLHRPPR